MHFHRVFFTLLLAGLVAAADPSTTLWYQQPAKDWMTQALPIGSGNLGAMLFGGMQHERIQFNEESLWIGDEQDTGAYQAFGDVFVDFSQADGTNYRRELDLSRAVHTVTYQSQGITYRNEAFASHPANVIVYRFTADQPGALTGTIRLTDMHQATITATGNRITLVGSLAGYTYKDGAATKPSAQYALALSYEAQVLVLHEGGTVEAIGTEMRVTKATTITIVLGAGTNFIQDRRQGWRGALPHDVVTKRVDAAAGRTWDDVLAEHVRDYQALFQRTRLDLGPDASSANLPTDERLQQIGKTGVPDPGFNELLFNYGRYLFIASSRRGGLPANLQGKWNNSNQPPWRCDYHTDINVQMNYWLADVANLSECFEPFAEWLNSIREVRTEATHAAFKKRGWLMRGESGLFGGSTWDWVPGTSAWLLQNSYDHYRFTGDQNYLRQRAYPAMKEVCEYWLDSLQTQPDGTLVTPIGLSPEHGPKEPGISFDQQLVWDLFTSTIEASVVLGVDSEFRAELVAKRAKLLPPKIGKWGQLQEWMIDRDDPKDHHRHLSHLIALYPGRQISPIITPGLAEAARISLNARGDESTGWSTANKINMWARLHDGERAYRLINTFTTLVTSTSTDYSEGGGIYANLLCAHPPFQIDGNFGYTAGVCEMLLQSHLGEIHLLPALPKAWANGSFANLRARGGVVVDATWGGGILNTLRLQSATNTQVVVRIGKTVSRIELQAGVARSFLGDLSPQ